MVNYEIKLLFKQTTSSRVKCKQCSKLVNGEEGYIKINLSHNWRQNHLDKRIVICMDCFKSWLDEIDKAKESRAKTYNKLIKTKILKNLK